jgi:hypothetical protein
MVALKGNVRWGLGRRSSGFQAAGRLGGFNTSPAQAALSRAFSCTAQAQAALGLVRWSALKGIDLPSVGPSLQGEASIEALLKLRFRGLFHAPPKLKLRLAW